MKRAISVLLLLVLTLGLLVGLSACSGKDKPAGGQFVDLPAASVAEMQVAADEYAQTWISKNTKDGFDAAAYLADAKAFAAQFGK